MTKSFLIKRGISVAAAMVLLAATTVSAAGDRIVRSVGQYNLNNPDGTTVVIDTDDIEANAQAIAQLQGQIGGLSFKYGTEAEVSGDSTKDDTKGYYWSKDSSGNWVKIGAVGTAIASDVLTGKKFSSESGVDIEGTMPNPTQAAVNAYTAPTTGTNVNAGSVESGNNVTITNSDGTSTASADTNIDLGIGQSVTIPRGYYNGDITIRNNVANRGSLAVSSTETGYYTNIKNGLDESYNLGYTAGLAESSSTSTSVEVTYHVQHTHGDYCYPTASMINASQSSWRTYHDDYDAEQGNTYDTEHYRYSVTCSVCGAIFSRERTSRDGKHNYMPQAQADAYNAFYAHLTNGRCRAGGIKCGKSDGIQNITDVSTLGAGDNVISATITY